MSLPQLFIASIETAFNRYLALDPEAFTRLANMEGKIIAIEIKGLNESLYLFPGDDGIMVLSDFDGDADTTLSGTPLALAKLSLSEDAAVVLFSGDVTITGDTRLGHQFKKILAQVNIDWEEQLSRVVGDITAHQIGNALRGFGQWFDRSKHAMELDVGEYLQEESRLLPAKAEIDRFIHQVDELRESVDRLQARVQKLIKTQQHH